LQHCRNNAAEDFIHHLAIPETREGFLEQEMLYIRDIWIGRVEFPAVKIKYHVSRGAEQGYISARLEEIRVIASQLGRCPSVIGHFV
jgi:hypothetical protein